VRSVKLTALAGALTLAGGLLVPAIDASAGQLSTVPTVLPVATRVVQVDVDGDHHDDEVTIEQNGADTFVVNVVTWAGQSDVRQFTSTIDDDWGIEPWYGAARFNGRKGYELLLLTSGGDGVMFRVLSWRLGELVWDKAPKSRMKGAYGWYLADLDFARFGYRFATSAAGKRYVRDFELYPHGSKWKGTIVNSVWKSGAWQMVSRHTVTLSASQANDYRNISGVTVIEQP